MPQGKNDGNSAMWLSQISWPGGLDCFLFQKQKPLQMCHVLVGASNPPAVPVGCLQQQGPQNQMPGTNGINLFSYFRHVRNVSQALPSSSISSEGLSRQNNSNIENAGFELMSFTVRQDLDHHHHHYHQFDHMHALQVSLLVHIHCSRFGRIGLVHTTSSSAYTIDESNPKALVQDKKGIVQGKEVKLV